MIITDFLALSEVACGLCTAMIRYFWIIKEDQTKNVTIMSTASSFVVARTVFSFLQRDSVNSRSYSACSGRIEMFYGNWKDGMFDFYAGRIFDFTELTKY